MRNVSLLALALFSLAAQASELKPFLGKYECTQILRTAPTPQQTNRVLVTITEASPMKAKLSWKEPNVGEASFETGEFGPGISPGDFEFRGTKPSPNTIPGVPAAQLPDVTVTLSKAPAGKYMSFSVNREQLGVVAASCQKKK